MRLVRLEPADAPRSPAFDAAAVELANDAVERSGPDDAAVLERLVEQAGPGATAVVVEAEPSGPGLVAAVDALGFDLLRTTLQLRRPLPLDDDHRGAPSPIVTRSFVPGVDEDAWVDVNNRAFAWHPDQAGRTRRDIEAEETEPWFRADGFLVHENADSVMDGFCWTKIHRDHEPPLGEIYVIGVDPSQHGHGLGRALVVAGLDWLAEAGLTEAMLYVEADNEPARHLYRSLGFVEHQAHRWWRRSLGPAERTGSRSP